MRLAIKHVQKATDTLFILCKHPIHSGCVCVRRVGGVCLCRRLRVFEVLE